MYYAKFICLVSENLVLQGGLLVVANVGDSRAVLATTDDDGRLVSVQLTVDLKPNLPRQFSSTFHTI